MPNYSSKLYLLILLLGSLGNHTAHAGEDGVPLHGFFDVGSGYSSRNAPVDQKIRHFRTGAVDLYLTPELGLGFSGLTEVVAEPDTFTGEFGIDVERLQVGYDFADFLKVWGGRFHTPIGIWNTMYHHGAQIQTSIRRPRFLDFEDHAGYFPIHSNGIWITGTQSVGFVQAYYDFYIANGPKFSASDAGVVLLDPNNITDNNGSFLIGGRARVEFGGKFHGLNIGIHSFTTTVDYEGTSVGFDSTQATYNPATSVPGNSTKVTMIGGFASFERSGVEAAAEYYAFLDKNKIPYASALHVNHLWYIQGGYNLFGRLTPYYRFEKASLDMSDYYFSNFTYGASYSRSVVGLRWSILSSSAIKVEYLNTALTGQSGASYNIVQGQLSIRF